MKTWVYESDLLKIRDALRANYKFHKARDEMNAAGHCADEVRSSPIQYETRAGLECVNEIINYPRDATEGRAENALMVLQEFIETNLIEATGDKRVLLESLLEIFDEHQVFDNYESEQLAKRMERAITARGNAFAA